MSKIVLSWLFIIFPIFAFADDPPEGYVLKADEFFYVISGTGTATLGDEDFQIEEGDVIFVPVGLDHEMTADSSPLVLLEFKDLPGLDEEFRAWHKRFVEGDEEMALDKLNEFARPLGTVYKTLD